MFPRHTGLVMTTLVDPVQLHEICSCCFPGLDDARNTAKLAWRMICDGCLMTITKTLTPVSVNSHMTLKCFCRITSHQ